MALRFAGFPHSPVYAASDLDGDWMAGEVRELGETHETRLLDDFPGAFLRVEALGAPDAHAAMESPGLPGAKRRGR